MPIVLLSLAPLACGDETTEPTADAGTADTGPADTGLPDTGVGDTGTEDDGGIMDGGVPTTTVAAVVDIADLVFDGFGSTATASYAVVHPPSHLPSSGCLSLGTGGASAAPKVGSLSLDGLTNSDFTCETRGSGESTKVYCVANPAGPPPISGPTVETGPWFGTETPEATVSGGEDLAGISVMAADLPSGTTIIAPTTLPADGAGDLEVRWTPTGDLDVHVELIQSYNGQSLGYVLCRPDTDGMLTIPGNLVDGHVLRLTVAHYSSAEATDAENQQLRLRTLRGHMLHQF